MPRGTQIIVNADSKGRRMSGYISGAIFPGTICQIDPTVTLKNGLFTFKVFSRSADGNRPAGAWWILDGDWKQGKLATDATVDGTLQEFYSPLNGDELNLRFFNQAGTGDDVAAGNLLIVRNNVGGVFVTTGSPQTEPAMALEAIVDPIADQLLWCSWSGE